MPYQVSMMGWVGSGEDFCGLGWVGLGPEIFGWVGFLKSDPWPTLPPHINNEEVRRRTGQPPVTSVIAKRRLRLFGSCGLRGCKNRPAPFPGPCRTRRLNQALSVLSLSLGFLSVSAVLLTRAPFCVCIILCYLWVLSHVLVRLSVGALLVQVIDWKDSSPKWPIMCW